MRLQKDVGFKRLVEFKSYLEEEEESYGGNTDERHLPLPNVLDIAVPRIIEEIDRQPKQRNRHRDANCLRENCIQRG